MIKVLKNKLFITIFVISLLSIITFSIVSFINWSLLTGYIIGLIIGTLSYLLDKLFITQLLSKRRSFKFSFFLSMCKTLIWILLLGGVLIGILFANNLLKESWTNGIFNVFTYIFGCITIPTSIIISNLFIKNN